MNAVQQIQRAIDLAGGQATDTEAVMAALMALPAEVRMAMVPEAVCALNALVFAMEDGFGFEYDYDLEAGNQATNAARRLLGQPEVNDTPICPPHDTLNRIGAKA